MFLVSRWGPLRGPRSRCKLRWKSSKSNSKQTLAIAASYLSHPHPNGRGASISYLDNNDNRSFQSSDSTPIPSSPPLPLSFTFSIPSLAQLITNERVLGLNLQERGGDICILQCLADQIPSSSGDMVILFAKDHDDLTLDFRNTRQRVGSLSLAQCF